MWNKYMVFRNNIVNEFLKNEWLTFPIGLAGTTAATTSSGPFLIKIKFQYPIVDNTQEARYLSYLKYYRTKIVKPNNIICLINIVKTSKVITLFYKLCYDPILILKQITIFIKTQ